jgi:trk system potassium uptake protein TrkA
MRIVFVGAGELAVGTARLLIERAHDVIIIERDLDLINRLKEELDCGYLHGDGSSPHVLEEAAPTKSDILFCLTDNDRDNIIASLVGRSLGFPQVVTRIESPEFETVCRELGLSDLIMPSRTISRYLADRVAGRDVLEWSAAIKGDAQLFSFIVGEDDVGRAEGLNLPTRTRAVCLYRGGEFQLCDSDTELRTGDEVVLLTDTKHMEKLRERWGRPSTSDKRGTSNNA